MTDPRHKLQHCVPPSRKVKTAGLDLREGWENRLTCNGCIIYAHLLYVHTMCGDAFTQVQTHTELFNFFKNWLCPKQSSGLQNCWRSGIHVTPQTSPRCGGMLFSGSKCTSPDKTRAGVSSQGFFLFDKKSPEDRPEIRVQPTWAWKSAIRACWWVGPLWVLAHRTVVRAAVLVSCQIPKAQASGFSGLFPVHCPDLASWASSRLYLSYKH